MKAELLLPIVFSGLLLAPKGVRASSSSSAHAPQRSSSRSLYSVARLFSSYFFTFGILFFFYLFNGVRALAAYFSTTKLFCAPAVIISHGADDGIEKKTIAGRPSTGRPSRRGKI
jgi:hypothetical protein